MDAKGGNNLTWCGRRRISTPQQDTMFIETKGPGDVSELCICLKIERPLKSRLNRRSASNTQTASPQLTVKSLLPAIVNLSHNSPVFYTLKR